MSVNRRPQHTIGDRKHNLYSLDEAKGLVRGIVKIDHPIDIKAENLVDYEHIEPGEDVVIEDSARIEIVDFGGEPTRFNYVSKIRVHQTDVAAGAKLTGPIVWRPVEVVEVQQGGGVEANEILLGIFTCALWAALVYIMPAFALGLSGCVLFLVLGTLAHHWIRDRRLRNIAKQGSAYVLAPAKRSWNRSAIAG